MCMHLFCPTQQRVMCCTKIFPLIYMKVCRNINQIKICMEAGRTVVLLNLDNLYESLYDLLNQVGAFELILASILAHSLLAHSISTLL